MLMHLLYCAALLLLLCQILVFSTPRVLQCLPLTPFYFVVPLVRRRAPRVADAAQARLRRLRWLLWGGVFLSPHVVFS
jgi:hypothetical protein